MSDKKNTYPPEKGTTREELPEIDPEDVFLVDDVTSPDHVLGPAMGTDSFAAPQENPDGESNGPLEAVGVEAKPAKAGGGKRPIISRAPEGPGGAAEKSTDQDGDSPRYPLPGFTPSPAAGSSSAATPEADIEWPQGVPSLTDATGLATVSEPALPAQGHPAPVETITTLPPTSPAPPAPPAVEETPLPSPKQESSQGRNSYLDLEFGELPPGIDHEPLSTVDFDLPAPDPDAGEATPDNARISPASLGVQVETPPEPRQPVKDSPDYQPFEDIEQEIGPPQPLRETVDGGNGKEESAALPEATLPPEEKSAAGAPDSSKDVSDLSPVGEAPESPFPMPEEPDRKDGASEEEEALLPLFSTEEPWDPEEAKKDFEQVPADEPRALEKDGQTETLSSLGEEYGQQAGWPVESPGSFPDFVFDRGGETMLSVSGSRVEEVKNITKQTGFLRYIVEYPEATTLDVRKFPGNVKYAQLLIHKQLEEQGELTSGGQVLLYCAQKSEANAFTALYQVVPQQTQATLQTRYRAYNHGFVIFDSVSLLRALLFTLDKKRVHALAMHCPGAILLLVGKGEEVLMAHRYALMGNDQTQLNEGLDTLQRDIELAEKLEGMVESLLWIEPILETIDTPPPETRLHLVPWPLTRLRKGDTTVFSALPGILKRLPLSSSLGPKEERWLRPLEIAEKWLWAFLLAGVLVCAGSWYLFTSLTSSTRLESTKIAQRIEETKRRLPKPQSLQSEQIEPSLMLAGKINQAAFAPPPAILWNEIAEATPGSVHIVSVTLAYGKKEVEIALAGETKLNLVESQAVFIEFLSRLEQAGFRVSREKMVLDIKGNSFSIELAKAYQ